MPGSPQRPRLALLRRASVDDFGFADLGTLGTWACHSDPRGYASFSGTGSRSFSWTSVTSDDVGSDPTAGYDLGPNKDA